MIKEMSGNQKGMANPPPPSQRPSASSGPAPISSQRPSASVGPAASVPPPHPSTPFPAPDSGAQVASFPSQRLSAAPPGQHPSAVRAPSSAVANPPSSHPPPADPSMLQRAMQRASQSPIPAAPGSLPVMESKSSRAPKEDFSSESGNVTKGQESKSKATAILERYRAPVALFPISLIEEFGFNEEKGLFWMKQPNKVEREFPDAEVVVHYGRVIAGNVEPNKIINLAGFKMKDMKEKNLFLPIPYNEIKVDGDQIMLLSGQGDPRAFASTLFRNASVPQRPGANVGIT